MNRIAHRVSRTLFCRAAGLFLLCSALGQAQAAAPAPHAAISSLPQQIQPQQGTAPADARFRALAEQYYEVLARFDPLWASFNGDHRYDDRLPLTLHPQVRAAETRALRSIRAKLSGIPRMTLSPGEQTSYDCMVYELDTTLSMQPFPSHLLPFNQMDSLPVTLAHFASGESAQRLETLADYRHFLSRLNALPDWLHTAEHNLRTGMRQGIVLPRALVVSSLPQFRTLTEPALDNHPYLAPLRHFPSTFSKHERAVLRASYERAFHQRILPALKTWLAFIEHTYLPASRTSTGWAALPGGATWYAALVKEQTTTRKTPEEIHQIGLQEVARIQSEFITLGPKLGYHGDPNGLPAWIDTQRQYRPFHSEEEVLAAYRNIDAQVRSQLPRLFSRVPKAPLDIRAEPPISRATASDHYTSPAIDGSRPGVFWAVIQDPQEYATTGMKTLFLHEGQPGHHFHLALLQELDIPRFRKFDSNNAYTEGWALYAETLGREMGVFDQDPNAYLGHLRDEMLRATRLVVDTGMHVKGWTREEGIRYLQDTLGYSEAESRQSIERYMAWPAQALGYKIGSLTLRALRNEAEAALGQRFDVRAFHEQVLGEGTLPLTLLENKIRHWIKVQSAQEAR